MGESTGTGTGAAARPRGLSAVAALMILFGLAEIVTGFTHNFFGVSTTEGVASTYWGTALGALYLLSGLLVLPMRRWAAACALAALGADVGGRLWMTFTGLYPTDSPKQVFAIVLGTSIVVVFGVYVGSKWRLFR